MDGSSFLLFWYKASEQIRRDLHVPAVITSRSYLPLGGIPLQNVVNFCCPLGRVPTVRGATMAKAEPPMQPLSNLKKIESAE